MGRSIFVRVAAALVLLNIASPARADLPTLGDPYDLSLNAERKIGVRVARELYRDPDYIDDPVLVEYVQSLWSPLLSAARLRGDVSPELDDRFAWQFLLGKDRSINAFALPGGWLGLHLGLVAVTASRDELASVLAHELSHVTQRHIARLITQDKRQAPWLIGAMILGTLAASKNADAGNAVIAGSQALAVQNQLNFSRDMEREADRIGLGVMVQAGFASQGFVSMFDKLHQASRLNDNGAFPYLRTHPLSTERMADMQSRRQLEERNPPAMPDLEHVLMAARARVLSNAGVDSLRGHLREADSLPPNAPRLQQSSALYAGALAAIKLRDVLLAERLLTRLRPVVNDDPKGARQARLLAAELAQAAGDSARVVALLDATATATGRPEALMRAQAQTQTGRAGEAAQRLQTWVALHPHDGTAWQLLAGAYAAQGQTLRAIRAEAEAQVAWLDYAAALDRLKAGQELARKGAGAGDHIEASIIDTRARQLESLVREQALER